MKKVYVVITVLTLIGFYQSSIAGSQKTTAKKVEKHQVDKSKKMPWFHPDCPDGGSPVYRGETPFPSCSGGGIDFFDTIDMSSLKKEEICVVAHGPNDDE